MLLVADVHGSFEALARVARSGGPLLILGDLVNFVDYRTGEGIAKDLFGEDFAAAVVAFRARGDFSASRALWRSHSQGREEEIQEAVGRHLARQYEQMAAALTGATGYVIHGNVDVPNLLKKHLPQGMSYIDGQTVDIEGWRVGFVGGGAPTGLNARGEVSEEAMRSHLAALGPVDILCSHQAPAVSVLHQDVITGRHEGASAAIHEYLVETQPAFHYFGDIHQPKASVWRVGQTRCINVGYFRATGRAVRHQ